MQISVIQISPLNSILNFHEKKNFPWKKFNLLARHLKTGYAFSFFGKVPRILITKTSNFCFRKSLKILQICCYEKIVILCISQLSNPYNRSSVKKIGSYFLFSYLLPVGVFIQSVVFCENLVYNKKLEWGLNFKILFVVKFKEEIIWFQINVSLTRPDIKLSKSENFPFFNCHRRYFHR